MNGGISQEESVLRRTNLYNIVNNSKHGNNVQYALPLFGGLYVPASTVFRSNESTGFKFLEVGCCLFVCLVVCNTITGTHQIILLARLRSPEPTTTTTATTTTATTATNRCGLRHNVETQD
jgi:hypothetical protein